VSRCRHPLTGVCTRMAACWYRACPRLQRSAWATRRVRDVAEPVTRSRHQRRDAGQNMRLELRGRGSLHLHEPALLCRNSAPNATLWWQAKDHGAEISLFLCGSGGSKRGSCIRRMKTHHMDRTLSCIALKARAGGGHHQWPSRNAKITGDRQNRMVG
jgi:hypothetical protein